jgi:arylsulfatase A-like enzyme
MEYNVIILTVDCLRQDHISSTGYDRKTTPNIDVVANKAMVFKNMISSGNCTPVSFPALMASIYPRIMDSGLDLLPTKSLLISEKLKEKKYTTIGIHSNPFLSKHFGYGRGFDVYEDMAGSVNSNTIKWLTIQNLVSKRLQKTPYFHQIKSIFSQYFLDKPFVNSQKIVDISMECIKKAKEPFFLWSHFMDCHFPYIYPEYEEKHVFTDISKIRLGRALGIADKTGKSTGIHLQDLIDLYDTNLRFVDHQVGRLLEYLVREGIYDNTIIIITSDHGEEFMEHGDLFHKEKLYNELIKVPLIIRHPDINRGLNINKKVSHIDIAPSILDFLGMMEERLYQGKSMLEKIEDEDEDYVISEAASVAFNEEQKRLFSITIGEMKYIYNLHEDILKKYDLRKDPQEKLGIIVEDWGEYATKILRTHILSRLGKEYSSHHQCLLDQTSQELYSTLNKPV